MTHVTSFLSLLVAVAVTALPAALAAQPAAAPKSPVAATQAAPPSPLSFAGMDRNADNRVSDEEFRNALAFVFAGQDGDQDDVVTRAEAERNGSDALKAFDSLDTGRTGRIDLETFLDFGMRVFRSADTDGNGFVTIAERDALRAKVRAQRAADKR